MALWTNGANFRASNAARRPGMELLHAQQVLRLDYGIKIALSFNIRGEVAVI